ncbi:hypothetical protein BH11BAC2_BH11BAC2_08200 [soil metagenome]
MKKTLLILVLFLASIFDAEAQLNKANQAAGSEMRATLPSAGSLLMELANNLDSSAFSDNWGSVKDTWMNDASKVTNPVELGKLTSALIENVKPTAFTDKFNKDKSGFMKSTTSPNNLNDIGLLFEKLQVGLKPTSFLPQWASKSNDWLQAIKLLK